MHNERRRGGRRQRAKFTAAATPPDSSAAMRPETDVAVNAVIDGRRYPLGVVTVVRGTLETQLREATEALWMPQLTEAGFTCEVAMSATS